LALFSGPVERRLPVHAKRARKLEQSALLVEPQPKPLCAADSANLDGERQIVVPE
jgi:hypothetical protein